MRTSGIFCSPVIPLGYYVILLGTEKYVFRCLKSTFLNFKSKQGTILGTRYFDTIWDDLRIVH